jgi:pilus assembly protein FimV
MGVAALGVGEIELHSALNQPLNAKIALVTSSSESLSDIKISLASPAAFKRAGVDRYFYLSNIRFKPVIASDGSISVKVTSHDIIREPFLNFLVEVNWPQGRALKEFTVLLDPPVTLREAETVIQVAPVTRRQERGSASSARGSESTISYSASPARTTVSAGPSVVGPTQKNDTLWSVALGANKDSSISQEQMMMSLYNKNRHAFYQDNVNALKRGQTLTIPTREEALALSKREASRQFSDQYKAWTAKSSKATVKPLRGQPESPSEGLESEHQLTLITPEEDIISDSAGLSEQGSGAGGNAEASADSSAEVAETARQENEELQKRMLSLEEQVSKMQRLLVLKDEQLAALQGGSVSETVPEEGVVEDESQNEGGAIAVDTADAVATEEETSASVEESDLSDEPTAEAIADVEAVAPLVEETPFYEDPIYLAAGGVALLLLGLALVAGRRKRAIEEDVSVAESILVGSEESVDSHDELIIPVVDSRESEAGIPAESSFLSEFTPSDFDTLDSDSDEVDPITEADVYLAYGRYQQAEDLVRQAIEAAPDNKEYKLKLLEIHFATEDKNAFLSLAEEIHAACAESNPELWMRAVEMGQDICPEEALFLDQGEALAEEELLVDDEALVEEEMGSSVEDDELVVAEPVEEKSDSVVFDFGEELSKEEPSDEQELEVADSLEFDFGEEITEVETKEVTGLNEEEESNLIDFGSVDLSDSIDEVAEEVALPIDDEVTEAPAEENDEFSFDFEMPPSATAEGEPELVASEDALDLNIDDDVVSSLTDMDEVETKLDLAKAYVDMEDETSAVGILEEVLTQGNDAQKAEAQSLMDGLKG